MDLTERSYELAHKLPWTEARGLRDQIERSSVSIPANIAEGNGRQRTGEYLRFLSIANGSLMELQTHLELVVRLRLLPPTQVARADALCADVSRLLRALIRSLEKLR